MTSTSGPSVLGGGPRRPRSGSALGRPFGTHLTAVGLANLADGIVQTGVPLLAVTLTRSPMLMGVLTAAVWLPWLLCGVPAGVLVDRWDRRRTMIWGLVLRALLLGVVAALAVADLLTVWVLVGLAFGYGVTEVFTDLAATAQVPAFVGREPSRLRRAHSRVLAVLNLCNGFAGPPLAGALLALGAGWMTGSAGVMVVAAVLVLLLGLRGRYAAPRPDGEPAGSVRAELAVGMRTLWRHPVLRPMLLAGGLWNFGSTAFSAVIILWLVGPGSAGGLSPQTFSLLLAVMPVGALLGSVLSEPVVARWSEIRVVVVCWGLNAVLNLVPLVWATAVGMALFFLAIGPLGVIGNVVTGSLRPRMVPEHLLGKVGGAARVVGFGAMPLGALAGGQVAELYGIPVVLVGVSAIMVGATAFLALSVSTQLIRDHELPHA